MSSPEPPKSPSPDPPEDPPTDPPETDPGTEPDDPDAPQTFTRAYVENLRRESANYRTKGQRADAMSQRLVTEMAKGTGKLADATDLPFTDELLGEDGFPDPALVDAAIDALLVQKPHLGDRRPSGSVEQGARTAETDTSLGDVLRARAR